MRNLTGKTASKNREISFVSKGINFAKGTDSTGGRAMKSANICWLTWEMAGFGQWSVVQKYWITAPDELIRVQLFEKFE